MRVKQIWPLIKDAVSAWQEDYAPSMGAALSYYTLFSIGPLLLIIIAVAGFVFGEEAARGEIMGQLQGLMGDSGAKAIEGMLASANRPTEGIIASVTGVVLLLVGATTVFGELQSDLDRIWRAPAREQSGLWSLLRTRLLSFGMILGLGFLLMISLVVSAALSALGKWWAPFFGGWEILAHAVNFVVSFAMITAIFALIYKLMPRAKIAWHDVWVGAAATALLFTIGKFVIGLYLGKSSVASSFGAAGSLVVVMLWVYYSAQIFLLGAEFTWVYSHAFGSRRGQERPRPGETTPVATTDAVTPASGRPAGIPGRTEPAVAPAGFAVARVPADAPVAELAVVSTPVVPAHAPASVHARAVLQQQAFLAVGVAAAVGLVAGGITSWKVRRKRHAMTPAATSSD